MSNKHVTNAYRQVIDRTINGVRADFEDNGIEEAVLAHLQQSWEAKLAQSQVTDFSNDPRLGAYQAMLSPPPQGPSNGVHADGGNGTSKPSHTVQAGDTKPSLASTSAAAAAVASVSATASTSRQSTESAKPKPDAESNELGSDLDESSDEDGDGADGDADRANDTDVRGDSILALYDKVHRVKNKWKLQLRDGIVSADGKDYLFNKLQGDVEW